MTTTEELLEAMFSVGYAPRLYSQDNRPTDKFLRVEVGSNTFTVALLVVGGDKKGT
jgi:hypothetical protein